MSEPYVPIARHTTAAALMTDLENALDTIDDDTDLIVADTSAALTARNSARDSAKRSSFGIMLGGA
jgi:hypothetical protein